MGQQSGEIKQALLEAGKIEFLEYGYDGASLRRIAKSAKVTTGAIYAHFSGKEELFDEITKEVVNEILHSFAEAHAGYETLPLNELLQGLEQRMNEYIPQVINYLYDHYDMMKLLLCCNRPERTEAFLDQVSSIEDWSIYRMREKMEEEDHRISHYGRPNCRVAIS